MMKWGEARRSDNVTSGGSGGGGGGFKLGIGGIALVVVIGLFFGKSPMEMLGLVSQIEQGDQPATGQPAPADNPTTDFVRAIVGETEDVWGALFAKRGKQAYAAPKLVLFSGSVRTACGGATSATGPFYCPADHEVYLDTSFFDEMRARLGGGGDFANAYVIAHEVGHHVQSLLGTTDKVDQARARGDNIAGDGGLLVRQELQADCYAGVWAHVAEQRHHWLETGDVEQALNTATAIGDDRLQRQANGTVTPDTFTHGTSEQRIRWFRAGFEAGDPARCDTFGAATL